MATIHVAGRSVDVDDGTAVRVLLNARHHIAENSVNTISVRVDNGTTTAFLVGPGIPIAIDLSDPDVLIDALEQSGFDVDMTTVHDDGPQIW